jgi:TPR repeat protein
VTVDLDRAFRLYQKACDAGERIGCANLGMMYMTGRHVERDPLRGQSLLERSCKLEFGPACSNLSEHFDRANDLARAFEFARLGCDAADARACVQLGYAYTQGRGVATNGRLALVAYEQGCNLGEPAGCADAGIVCEEGNIIPQDLPRALAHYRRACDAGFPRACSSLGFLFAMGKGVAVDNAKAKRHFESACTGGFGMACKNLGIMFETGAAGSKDAKRALELFDKACKNGDPDGCARSQSAGAGKQR